MNLTHMDAWFWRRGSCRCWVLFQAFVNLIAFKCIINATPLAWRAGSPCDHIPSARLRRRANSGGWRRDQALSLFAASSFRSCKSISIALERKSQAVVLNWDIESSRQRVAQIPNEKAKNSVSSNAVNRCITQGSLNMPGCSRQWKASLKHFSPKTALEHIRWSLKLILPSSPWNLQRENINWSWQQKPLCCHRQVRKIRRWQDQSSNTHSHIEQGIIDLHLSLTGSRKSEATGCGRISIIKR